MNVTTESIKQAHAYDTHPSNVFASWCDDDLYRPAHPDDTNLDSVLALRITYQDSQGNALPDADFVSLVDAGDASVRDAASISRHHDVYGVAIYPASSDGVRSPYPLAVIIDGTSVPLDGSF